MQITDQRRGAHTAAMRRQALNTWSKGLRTCLGPLAADGAKQGVDEGEARADILQARADAVKQPPLLAQAARHCLRLAHDVVQLRASSAMCMAYMPGANADHANECTPQTMQHANCMQDRDRAA